MIAGAGMAGQAIGALGAGVAGLTGALGPLAGAGAAGAVGLTALGQAAGVGKLALAGIGKALGGNKKALDALTPSQRAFLQELKAMQGEVRGLQETAARGMLPGLSTALKSVTPLLSTLRPIIYGTARALGDLAAAGGRMVGGWGGDLQTVGRTNITIIRNIGTAALFAARGAKDLVVVAGPLATWMSEMAARGAKFVATQIQAGRESGRLAAFFEKTRAVMVTLGHITANLGVALFNIFKAAAPLGRDMLGSFERLTKRFRDWTASAEGKNKIAAYFRDAREPLRQLFGLVGDLASALGRLMRPTRQAGGMIAGLRELVPLLESVLQMATTTLGPPLVDLLKNLAAIATVFIGTSGPLTLTVKALDLLSKVVSALIQNVLGLGAVLSTIIGIGAAYKLLNLAFKPAIVGVNAMVGIWARLAGGAKASIAPQVEAGAAAQRSGALGGAAVAGLAGAWAKVAGSASEAAAAQTIAGAKAGTGGQMSMFAGTVGGKATKGEQLGLFPLPAESAAQIAKTEQAAAAATTSRFQGLMSKLQGTAAVAMRGAGIAIGGMLLTQIAAQIAGPGATANWIKAIGTGATIGAAFGSIFGPLGAAGFGVIGGLTAAVAKFINDQAQAEGKAWSQRFSAGLDINIPPAAAKAFQDRLAKLYSDLQSRLGSQTQVQQYGQRYAQGGLKLADFVDPKIAKDAWNLGWVAQQQFRTAFGAAQVKTTPVFIQDAIGQLQQLPAIARNQATVMLMNYAAELVSKKQLPASAMEQILGAIEAQFPQFQAYMYGQGLTTAQAMANSFRLDAARKNLGDALGGMRQQYGVFYGNMGTDNKSILSNFQTTYDALQAAMVGKTGKAKQRVLADINTLVTLFAQYMASLNQDTGSKTSALRGMFDHVGKTIGGVRGAVDGLVRSIENLPGHKKTTVDVSIDFASNIAGAISSIGQSIGAAVAGKGTPKPGPGGFFARGGVVKQMGYFAGEEGRSHPEVIIASNPRYRRRNLGLWARAGGMLGIPGFAAGGVAGANAGKIVASTPPWAAKKGSDYIRPLAKAWGVSHSMAGKMIAAAGQILGTPYVYGGGHPGAVNGGYDCSGAVSYVLRAAGLLAGSMTTDGLKNWGDPGPGRYITVGVRGTSGRSAHTMMAFFGRYFESGGSGGGPHWTAGWDGTFPIMRHPPGYARGGIYRKGDFGDVPPQMLLATQPALAKSAAFWRYAKRYGVPGFAEGGVAFRVMGSLERAGGTGAFGFSPGGMGYSILGRVGDSTDRGANTGRALGPGWWTPPSPLYVRHAGIVKTLTLQDRGSGSPGLHPYPSVGIYPQAAAALAMGDNGMIDIERTSGKAFTALRGVPISPFGLLAKTGKAKTSKPAPNMPKTAAPVPKLPTRGGLRRLQALVGRWTAGLKPINESFGALNAMLATGGTVDKLREQYDISDTLFQTLHPNLAYIKTLADGTSAVDEDAVKLGLQHLLELRGYQQRIIDEYEKARELIASLLDRIRGEIERRRREIEVIQERIRTNLHGNQQLVDPLRKGPIPMLVENIDQLTVLWKREKNKKKKSVLLGRIQRLQDENQALGGNRNAVGTGGLIGQLSGQIGVLRSRRGDINTLQSAAFGLTGRGGDNFTAQMSLIKINQDIKPLWDWAYANKTGDLAAQIAEANRNVQQATSPTPDQTRLNDALKQQVRETQLALAVSAAQRKALETLPPYGGSFATGGVVPGPIGAPRTVIAHGGEPIGDTPIQVNVTFGSGMEWLRQFVKVEVQQQTRRDARVRTLPGGRT